MRRIATASVIVFIAAMVILCRYVSILNGNRTISELEKQFEAAFPGVSCVKNKYRGDIAFLTENQPESVTREKLKGISSAKSVKVLHTLGLRG